MILRIQRVAGVVNLQGEWLDRFGGHSNSEELMKTFAAKGNEAVQAAVGALMDWADAQEAVLAGALDKYETSMDALRAIDTLQVRVNELKAAGK